jgi:hypothetical protein
MKKHPLERGIIQPKQTLRGYKEPGRWRFAIMIANTWSVDPTKPCPGVLYRELAAALAMKGDSE